MPTDSLEVALATPDLTEIADVVGGLGRSPWVRELGILLVVTLLTWPLSRWIAARLQPPAGREASREEKLLRHLLRSAVWPVLALGLSAASTEVVSRYAPGLSVADHQALPILAFFLVYRLLDATLQEFVPKGPRRRRVRRGVMPVLFGLLVLQQLGLIGPILASMQRPLLTIGETSLTAFSLAVAVGAVLGFALFGRLLAAIVGGRILTGFGVDRPLAEAIGTVVRYVLVVIGFVWGLEILGFDLTALKIAFGALGVGIGFGLQNIVNNFTSGLILLFERSVKRGDVLTVSGTDGRVEQVGLRASVIRTREGDDLIIPNSTLVENMVTNYSFRDVLKRVDVAIGVSYSADPNRVREILLRTAGACDEILPEPPPTVIFTAFGESSIDFSLRVWIDDAWKVPLVRSRLLFDIWYALKADGIEIPFPQRDLHIRSGVLPVRRLEREAEAD